MIGGQLLVVKIANRGRDAERLAGSARLMEVALKGCPNGGIVAIALRPSFNDDDGARVALLSPAPRAGGFFMTTYPALSKYRTM